MHFDKLVDLHCHILPGIDDGSESLEKSLALAQAAIADGVTHILATPHHLDNQYVNHKADVIKLCDQFQAELDRQKLPLSVFAGQEVHINGDLIEKYDDLLGIDEDKHYMLLEFPHGEVPAYAKRMIFDLRKKGTTPVICHPERNHEIQENLDLLYEFIENGALAQLTATSYIGGFGEHVAELSHKMVEHNLVQIIASDAHNLPGRKFVLSEALNQVAQDFDAGKAQAFEANAEKLINGDYVAAHDYSPIPMKKKKKFFFF